LKTKVSKIFSYFGYELGIFIILGIQAFLNRGMIINMEKDFFSYYLLDYSMGFNSRMLVGSFINLLTDNPTASWLKGFMITVLVLTLLAVSLLLGRIIRCTEKEKRNVLYVFILFFVFGTLTMYGFSRYFGLLDIHLFICALLAVVCATNKYLRWFTPVFALAGVFVYYPFTLTYFVAVIGVCFYFAIKEKQSKSNFVIFLITAVAVVGATYFFAFEARDFMKVTFDELWQIMEQKSGLKFEYDEIRPFDMFFYGNSVDMELGHEVRDMTPFEVIKTVFMVTTGQVGEFHEVNYDGVLSLCMILLVVLAGFVPIWVLCMKNSETKPQKFVFLCFILGILFIPISWLVSTDYSRLAQAGVLNQFIFAFVMFFRHDSAFEKTLEQLKSFFKGKEILLVIYFLIYASCFQLSWGV
jgi:hypothetical protein